MDTIYLVLIVIADSLTGVHGMNATALPSNEMCEQMAYIQNATAQSPPGYRSASVCVTLRDLEKSIRQHSCTLVESDGQPIPSYTYVCSKGYR